LTQVSCCRLRALTIMLGDPSDEQTLYSGSTSEEAFSRIAKTAMEGVTHQRCTVTGRQMLAFNVCLDPNVLDRLLSRHDMLALVPAWKAQADRMRNNSLARAWYLLINRRPKGESRNKQADLCSLLGITALFAVAPTCRSLLDATERFVICPGCNRHPKQFRLACGHATCACTNPMCPRCNCYFDAYDSQSMATMTDQDPRSCTELDAVLDEDSQDSSADTQEAHGSSSHSGCVLTSGPASRSSIAVQIEQCALR